MTLDGPAGEDANWLFSVRRSYLQFLFADHNSPFAVAMVITLIIAAIELVSVLVGLGLSDLVDSMLPDLDPGET